jgi:hypothetical protein
MEPSMHIHNVALVSIEEKPFGTEGKTTTDILLYDSNHNVIFKLFAYHPANEEA